MKKKLFTHSGKPGTNMQELQSVAIVALAVALIVLSAIVAVLLAQVQGHKSSIEDLQEQIFNVRMNAR